MIFFRFNQIQLSVEIYDFGSASPPKLRYKKYTEKVAKSLTQVDPKNLPPTSAAAKYHSYRVFLQVTEWKDIDCYISPES